MNSFRFLVERYLTPVGHSGNDIIYVCPHCDDSKGHLYINYEKNKLHCFKCGYGSKSIARLLVDLGVDLRYDYSKLESDYASELSDVISMKDKKRDKMVVDYSRNLKILTDYYHAHTKELSDVARAYLHGRGLSDELIHKLMLREGISRYNETLLIRGKSLVGRDYSGRIMVPSLRSKDSLISFYLGRDYIGDKRNKYVNPPQELAYSSEDVWSLEIVETPYVVICEGVFSALAVNNALGKFSAVATYGKSISSRTNSDNPFLEVTSQGEKLLSKQFSLYIIFYDKDAIESAINTGRYLYERGANVRLVRIPQHMYGEKADANDMKKEEILDLIRNSEVFDRFTGVY